MIGSSQPKVLVEFYNKILNVKPAMAEEEWASWKVGDANFSVGPHSEVKGPAKEPARIILNFETDKVKEEFERMAALGAHVIKEPYEMEGYAGMWIATFSDPDGNYFQLMSPWKEE